VNGIRFKVKKSQSLESGPPGGGMIDGLVEKGLLGGGKVRHRETEFHSPFMRTKRLLPPVTEGRHAHATESNQTLRRTWTLKICTGGKSRVLGT